MATHPVSTRFDDLDALLDLGFAYSTGTCGCEFDLVSAHKWFNLAAASGDASSVGSRDMVAADMTPAQIAEAQRLASAWTVRPAN